MRDLNDILTRHALAALEEADQAERKASGGAVTLGIVAQRMANLMGDDVQSESVAKQLKRILYHGAKWRIDYIQAFAYALGKDPVQLISVDPKMVSEATKSQLLWTAIGTRLDYTQTRMVVRIASQLLDTPERWRFALEAAALVLEAESKADAITSLNALLAKTEAFDSKRRNLRSSPTAGKKIRT